MTPAWIDGALARLIDLLAAPFGSREERARKPPAPDEPDDLPPLWYLT